MLEPVLHHGTSACSDAGGGGPSPKRARLQQGRIESCGEDLGQTSKRARLEAPPPVSPSASAVWKLLLRPSDLSSFPEAAQRLWSLEAAHRLRPGKDFRLDHQARAASLRSGCDRCAHPLFAYVDETRLRAQPCTSTFLALLNNYERCTHKAERMTAERYAEERAFVSELVTTPHIEFTRLVLESWGLFEGNQEAFAAKLHQLWFTTYALERGGPRCSSGFEHVFVGEEKWDKWKHRSVIVGFHNWIQFLMEERAGRMDYRGYVGQCPGSDDELVSVRFAWEDDDPEEETKSLSTFLIGTSVAFEIALYTLAFWCSGGKAAISGLALGSLGPMTLRTFPWSTSAGQVIRTAFLESE